MLTIGLDPGTATTGWGVVELAKSKKDPHYVDCGIISTSSKTPMEKRLLEIHKDILSLIKKYNPQAFIVENIFFNTNAKTALLVGQARGVAILTAAQKKLSIFSYTPLQVKMVITGYGRADKQQMQQMVKTLLKLPRIPKPDDAADALAVALTHCFTIKN